MPYPARRGAQPADAPSRGPDAAFHPRCYPWVAAGASTASTRCSAPAPAAVTAHVRRLFSALGRLTGIQKRVHPYGLRHTHAAQLREEGVDIGIISKQLGHQSIATTAQYLDHIAPYAVIEAIRNRLWSE